MSTARDGYRESNESMVLNAHLLNLREASAFLEPYIPIGTNGGCVPSRLASSVKDIST